MGKGSSAPEAPDPYETASADAQFNRLDTYSPSGSGVRYGYTNPATGQFVQGTSPGEGYQSAVQQQESTWEQQIRQALEPASVSLTNRVISDNITGMPDAPRAQDMGQIGQTIFDRNMSMMMPSINKANDKLLTNLQARGLPVGSEAFNSAYGEQQKQTQDTISRLAMDSDIASGQEQSRLFSLDSASRQGAISELVAAMGGGYNPPSATPSGAASSVNYSGLAGQKYQADLAASQASNQQAASTASTLGSLGAGMLMKSDRRLKRDILAIGQRGPFTLYQYRYLWDAPGTIRRGYMAQEVLRVLPRAVVRMGRWMGLDYAQLPKVE
jgi:hypothetical protein